MYKKILKHIQKTEKLQKGSLQSRMKFNPQKDVSGKERQEVEDWVRQGGNEEVYGEKDREQIPEMNPNAKKRSLHKILKYTESKIHPETGERMFLLHRGVSNEENKKIKTEGHAGKVSSWTPLFNQAKLFAKKYNSKNNENNDENEDDNIISAWIPESQIQHIPNSIGSIKDQEKGDVNSGKYNRDTGKIEGITHKRKGKVGKVADYYGGEQEIIVKPHAFDLYDNSELKEKHKHNEDYEDDWIDDESVEWDLKNKKKQYTPHERIKNRVQNKELENNFITNQINNKGGIKDILGIQKSETSQSSTNTVKINPEHGKKIADAYGQLKHEPDHPQVQEAYNSLINETKDQFHNIMKNGLKISRIEPGMPNPYKNSKELHADIKNNNHLWYYPTESGFGSGEETSKHPMLQGTGIKHGDKELLANDVFRIVHDVNGHHLGGESGFGAEGEHKAYLTHKKMYSPLAQKALATETLMQNSYVNFGPNAEHNRKNPDKTIYADQKAALAPDWVVNGNWHNKQ